MIWKLPPACRNASPKIFGEATDPVSGGRPHPARCAPARRCGPDRMDRTAGRPASRPTFACQKPNCRPRSGCMPAEQRAALELAADRIRRFHQAQPVTSWMTQSLRRHPGPVRAPHPPGWDLCSRRNGPPALFGADVSCSRPGRRGERNCAGRPAQPRHRQHCPDYPGRGSPDRHQRSLCHRRCAGHRRAGLWHQSIRAVDKIFGPGNLFVTLAKRQVYGVVGIDSLAGPTETVVIADDTARPAWVAADLLAQAEHDVLAAAILLTPSAATWPKRCRSKLAGSWKSAAGQT